MLRSTTTLGLRLALRTCRASLRMLELHGRSRRARRAFPVARSVREGSWIASRALGHALFRCCVPASTRRTRRASVVCRATLGTQLACGCCPVGRELTLLALRASTRAGKLGVRAGTAVGAVNVASVSGVLSNDALLADRGAIEIGEHPRGTGNALVEMLREWCIWLVGREVATGKAARAVEATQGISKHACEAHFAHLETSLVRVRAERAANLFLTKRLHRDMTQGGKHAVNGTRMLREASIRTELASRRFGGIGVSTSNARRAVQSCKPNHVARTTGGASDAAAARSQRSGEAGGTCNARTHANLIGKASRRTW